MKRSLSIAGLVLSLAACAPTARVAPPPAPAAVAPAAQSQGDAGPLLTFVGAGAIGQEAAVAAPSFGGLVNVNIEAQYVSANGRTCRRFTVRSSQAAPRTHYACQVSGGWQLVM